MKQQEEIPRMAPSHPVAIHAMAAPVRATPSIYPTILAARVKGREKRPLGDLFGLTNFGINLTRLPPGAASSLRHAHAKQDEFVYILQGTPTLHTNEGKLELSPGMCAGFKAGNGNAHSLINESQEDVVYLEIGDRTDGDDVAYPDDDLCARLVDGTWLFSRKDGTSY
ncbi:MAG: cupin domain-containing protein [Pseudomonadota bacterium]